ILGLALILFVMDSMSAFAADKHPGEKLYRKKTCFACHGKGGAHGVLSYPHLAGQQKEYLLSQYNDIKSGKRVASADDSGSPRTKGMKDVLHVVSDDEVSQIFDWLSQQTIALKGVESISEDRRKAGSELYTTKGCIACHGVRGYAPIAPSYAVIGGQKSEYIYLQLKDIKDGVRTNGQSAVMAPLVSPLTDEEMKLLGDYLATCEK
ncbi:MAG: c-type cytochrome, partial [Bdellovibrionales bacterium]|nr:c-type cytochrome [Bdellovibrionales bacterium]